MIKKIASFILILACAFSFTFTWSAFNVKNANSVHAEDVLEEDSDSTNHTVTTNVNEIFDLDQKEPEDYEKDSVSPDGRNVNDVFVSIVEHELILTTSSKGNTSAQVRVIDQMSLTEQKPASNNFSLDGTYGMSYVDSVGFNALGNAGGNRDSYVAYVGVSQKNLKLIVVDVAGKTVVSQYDFGKASWLASDSVPQFTYKHFIDITAGDFDKDGSDELAVVALTDSANSIYLFDDYTLQSHKSFNITSLVDTSKVKTDHFIKTNSGKSWRPIVALASGDFDMDDTEELAVSISTSKHSVPSNITKETITTNVAVVDLPLSTATVYKHSVVGKATVSEDNKSTTNRLLYSSAMAVGDVNSDGIDEMIIAGYVGDVTKQGSNLNNKYSVSEKNIGLTTVNLVDEKLSNSEVTVHSMNDFIKDGFYRGDDVWTPLAIETASINGPQTADLVFVSGTIYDFVNPTPAEKHVYNLFKNDSERGSNAYVEKVVSGNFTNDTLGREGFAFSVCYKYIGQHKYSYQLGFIQGSYNDDEDAGHYGFNVRYNDNTNATKGKYWIDEKGGYVDTASKHYGTNFSLATADCDDDGIQLKYLGTNYAYSDPEVKAVLQSAPYFKELGSADDFGGGTSYTITTSYASSYSRSDSVGGEAGVFTGFDAGVPLFGKAKVKLSLTAGGAHTWESEEEYAKTYSDSFSASVSDTVILCRTPIKEFRYEILNKKEEVGELFFSTVQLKPVYYQLSVDDYNVFVDAYNAKLEEYNAKGYSNQATVFLKKIDSDFLPENTAGNPQNFYKQLPVSGMLLSKSTYAFGHNAGSTSTEFEESKSESTGVTKSFHIAIGGEIEGEVGFIFANASVGTTASFEYSYDRTTSNSKSIAISMGGEVGNANSDSDRFPNPETIKRFNFNWQFAKWDRQISTDGKTVPVVGYIVRDVTRAGPTAESVIAEFNNSTNNVDLSWEKSTESTEDTLLGFIIYRQVDGGTIDQIAEVSADATSFTEPYSNLTSRATYTYYVSAKYLRSGTDNEYYECRSVETANVVGGIEIDQGQTWVGINSLSEITQSGHYYLLDFIVETTMLTITGDVVLDLNGQIVDFDSSRVLITIEEGASLELYDISGDGCIFGGTLEEVGRDTPMIINHGNLTISGAMIASNGYIVENFGTLTINSGYFYIFEGYVIENVENGIIFLNGGEFYSFGSSNAYGIYHDGAQLVVAGGEFVYLTTGIDVQLGKYITLNSIYIPKTSVPVRVLDENGVSVTGEFTNEVGNLAEFLHTTFTTIDSESDVCLSSNGKIMVCYHKFVSHGIQQYPTCEVEGYELHVCEICSAYTTTVIEPLGHDYGEWIEEVEATTHSYGVVAHYHCSRCNKHFDENHKELHAIYIGKTGEKGEQGDKGETGEAGQDGQDGKDGQDGNGIVSIELLSSEGLVDTYKITFADGTFTTFMVKNGEKGKTGGCQASLIGSNGSNSFGSLFIPLLLVASASCLILTLKRKNQKNK